MCVHYNILFVVLSVGLPKPGVQLSDRFAAGLHINQVIVLAILYHFLFHILPFSDTVVFGGKILIKFWMQTAVVDARGLVGGVRRPAKDD